MSKPEVTRLTMIRGGGIGILPIADLPAAAIAATGAALDPIYAAIATQREADQLHIEACDRLCASGMSDPEYAALEAATDVACAAYEEATRALFLTEPTTLAGAAALFRYLAECLDGDDTEILRAPMTDYTDEELEPMLAGEQLVRTFARVLDRLAAASA